MKKLELFNNEAKELPYQRLPEQLVSITQKTNTMPAE